MSRQTRWLGSVWHITSQGECIPLSVDPEDITREDRGDGDEDAQDTPLRSGTDDRRITSDELRRILGAVMQARREAQSIRESAMRERERSAQERARSSLHKRRARMLRQEH